MTTGGDLHALATDLFPINRSLTGPGFRKTLDILEQTTGPMERHEFASGEPVHDWTIPNEWTLRDAWVKGPDGAKVIDFSRSNLHVVGYSTPVHEVMPVAELQKHLHSDPDLPDAIPYRTSYYKEAWGFCLPHVERAALPEGDYEVCIDADLAPGHVVVGEVVVEGTDPTAGEILLSTYCCHPSMANNELSGPVIVAHLARALAERGPRRTHRFLFLPETIGSIAYLSRFGERLKERLVAGYVVTCAGDPGRLHYKRSRRGDTIADRAAESILAGLDHAILDFFPTGSDERQFCSPGYDLPVGSLMRTPYGRYREYHTSLDDLSLITADALEGSFVTYLEILDALEATEVYAATAPYGEPQLGRRGLYPQMGGPSHGERSLHDMLWLLNLCDGTVELDRIAARIERPVDELRPAARRLVEAGLLVSR
jgi:aminopeptidase-like protein